MKPLHLNKESLVKGKEVVKDTQFRSHLKDSAVSASKAGLRARAVAKQKDSQKKSRYLLKGLILTSIGVALVAVLLKKKSDL